MSMLETATELRKEKGLLWPQQLHGWRLMAGLGNENPGFSGQVLKMGPSLSRSVGTLPNRGYLTSLFA